MFKQMVILITAISLASAQTGVRMDAHALHHGQENETEMLVSGMPSILSLNISMAMDGSGTSWLPAASNTPMQMIHAGNWMLMTHRNLFLRYSYQWGPRGGEQFSAPNCDLILD